MKQPIIDDEKSAVAYIQMILNDWAVWVTHHKTLVQALKYVLSANKRLTKENERLRANGKWLPNGKTALGHPRYKCSCCGYNIGVPMVAPNYCSKCGAKMKGE